MDEWSLQENGAQRPCRPCNLDEVFFSSCALHYSWGNYYHLKTLEFRMRYLQYCLKLQGCFIPKNTNHCKARFRPSSRCSPGKLEGKPSSFPTWRLLENHQNFHTVQEILHQLRLAVYSIIYSFFWKIPGGAGFLPTTVGNTSSSRVDFPASHVTRK